MTVYSVSLKTCFDDEDFHLQMHEAFGDLFLVWEIIGEESGWPLVRYTCVDRDTMIKLLASFADCDPADITDDDLDRLAVAAD